MGTQPENTHGIQTQTQPNPYPKFGSGPGITLGYPNFGYPIPTIVDKGKDWKKKSVHNAWLVPPMVGIGYPKLGYPRVIPGPEPNFGYG